MWVVCVKIPVGNFYTSWYVASASSITPNPSMALNFYSQEQAATYCRENAVKGNLEIIRR